jgi:hypothetical protein
VTGGERIPRENQEFADEVGGHMIPPNTSTILYDPSKSVARKLPKHIIVLQLGNVYAKEGGLKARPL